MRNPWLDIPLGDYEAHMTLPSVGQATMLAAQFELLIARKSPASVAVIGCAGGNGLERIADGEPTKVVAVDLNPKYVEETRNRHGPRLPGLELYCADVQSPALRFGPVDLIYAALIFEYVDVASTLATLRRNCSPHGTLAVLLQLPSPEQHVVSASPYASLGALGPVIRLVAPMDLRTAAEAAGFTCEVSSTIQIASGKRFALQIFQAAGQWTPR
jgi:hypothetical protein